MKKVIFKPSVCRCLFEIHSDILSPAPREETFLAVEGTNEKTLTSNLVRSVSS